VKVFKDIQPLDYSDLDGKTVKLHWADNGVSQTLIAQDVGTKVIYVILSTMEVSE